MRTPIFIVVTLVSALLVAGRAHAAPYTEISPDGEDLIPVTVGSCTLVSTPEEVDASHVYTTNIGHTIELNTRYQISWLRDARCDELQFHVNHNTTISRLNAWLNSIALGWYANMGASPYNGQTIWVHDEWFFVDHGVLRQIPDWLTGLAWGLRMQDSKSIHFTHSTALLDRVTIGTPLQFGEGQWHRGVTAFWRNGNRNYSRFPLGIRQEIKRMVRGNVYNDFMNVWTSCTYVDGVMRRRSSISYLDWSWMLRNPGCALAGS